MQPGRRSIAALGLLLGLAGPGEPGGGRAVLRQALRGADGGITDLSAGFHTNLREGRLGGRWEQLAGLGVQQRLGILRARLGASSDFGGGSLVGGGLSLGPLNLGLARWADGESERGGDANGWIFTFGLGAEGRVLTR